MPFNGSGTFTLVAGNPVVTGTVINSTVHNNTTSDLTANGLSNCLTKDGQNALSANLPGGGFSLTSAGIAAINGSVSTPALRFANSPSSGLYRIGADNIGVAIAGVKLLDLAATSFTITGALSVTGNVTLGDASGDSLTVAPNAVTWSNNPTHSGNHTFSGTVTLGTVAGTPTFTGAVTFSSTLASGNYTTTNSDNTSAAVNQIVLQRGTGAGTDFNLASTGDTSNGVASVIGKFGSTAVITLNSSGINGDIGQTTAGKVKTTQAVSLSGSTTTSSTPGAQTTLFTLPLDESAGAMYLAWAMLAAADGNSYTSYIIITAEFGNSYGLTTVNHAATKFTFGQTGGNGVFQATNVHADSEGRAVKWGYIRFGP